MTLIDDPVTLQLILLPVTLSCVAVTALVLCDFYQLRAGRYLFKPLAAAAFIWLAMVLGAADSNYGRWLFAGLLCCAAGDLLLMPDSERSFLAGLFAFLCGHLLYAVAFMNLSTNLNGMAISGAPALILLAVAFFWLAPHINQEMKAPVALYTLVITGMLLCAGLSAGQPAALLIIGGAWGFAISDLAVARQQFAHPSRINGLWGTPLYFFSQMLLAGSIALA
jgi:uncharacterized membrane protein YhhN